MDAIKNGKIAIEIASALIKYGRENRNVGRYYEASRKFDSLCEYIHGRGAKTLCPIGNLVIEDMITGSAAFQDMMETPVTSVNWDILSVMVYTSAFVGYSKGLLSPTDARWYLYAAARDMKERFWDRAAISIGCTYIGKLGDEPYYATPAELLPDMQAAKAALIDDVTIYNLEGILRYGKPEEWFETLLQCEPKIPPRSLKIDVVRSALQGISRLA